MKNPKQKYPAESKELTVKRVQAGQSIGAIALDDQTAMGQCGSNRQTQRPRNQVGYIRADGSTYREHTAQAEERNPKKCDGILRKRYAVNYVERFCGPQKDPLGDNRRRGHSTHGHASPRKFLNNWLSGQHEKGLAA